MATTKKHTDYKKVICLLISEGYVTIDEVKAIAEKLEPVSPKEGPTWDSAKSLMSELKELIIQNGNKPFTDTQANLASLEKLIRIDKHTEEECRKVLYFAMSDDFWSGVILSPANFRKHYDKIVVKMNRVGKVAKPVETAYPYAKENAEKERERREAVLKEAEQATFPEALREWRKNGGR